MNSQCGNLSGPVSRALLVRMIVLLLTACVLPLAAQDFRAQGHAGNPGAQPETPAPSRPEHNPVWVGHFHRITISDDARDFLVFDLELFTVSEDGDAMERRSQHIYRVNRDEGTITNGQLTLPFEETHSLPQAMNAALSDLAEVLYYLARLVELNGKSNANADARTPLRPLPSPVVLHGD